MLNPPRHQGLSPRLAVDCEVMEVEHAHYAAATDAVRVPCLRKLGVCACALENNGVMDIFVRRKKLMRAEHEKHKIND